MVDERALHTFFALNSLFDVFLGFKIGECSRSSLDTVQWTAQPRIPFVQAAQEKYVCVFAYVFAFRLVLVCAPVGVLVGVGVCSRSSLGSLISLVQSAQTTPVGVLPPPASRLDICQLCHIFNFSCSGS